MAQFSGTIEEFKRFFDGYCKGTVNAITIDIKRNRHNVCTCCGQRAELTAVHIREWTQEKVITRLLHNHFSKSSNDFVVDLKEFERLFISILSPIEDHFHFLCKECCDKYCSGKITDEMIIGREISSKLSSPTPTPPRLNYELLYRQNNEPIQAYVKRIICNLEEDYHWITSDILQKLLDKEYCKENFFLYFPLLNSSRFDNKGQARYYKDRIYVGGKYYFLCTEWWKDRTNIYFSKWHQWITKLIEQKTKSPVCPKPLEPIPPNTKKGTEVASPPSIPKKSVTIGSNVNIIRDRATEEETYFIVSADNLSPDDWNYNIISDENPIGKALIGHGLGEIVTVIPEKDFKGEQPDNFDVKIIDIQ